MGELEGDEGAQLLIIVSSLGLFVILIRKWETFPLLAFFFGLFFRRRVVAALIAVFGAVSAQCTRPLSLLNVRNTYISTLCCQVHDECVDGGGGTKWKPSSMRTVPSLVQE